jgi:hypothetical protein
MIVTVLHRLQSPGGTYENAFLDVAPNTYYAPAIAWGATAGIISGFGDGTFAPESLLTKEQLAVILYKYANTLGAELPKSANATPPATSPWAAEAVNALLGAQILDPQNFIPSSPITRGEIVTAFRKLIDAVQ